MSCIEAIEKTKIVTVIRGVYGKDLENLLSALFDGGIRAAEITFDQSGTVKDEETAREIKAAVKQMSGKMHIGAGTVLYEKQVNLACGAAGFGISSGIVDKKLIAQGDFNAVARHAREYIEEAKG